jgi:hypothetical protein
MSHMPRGPLFGTPTRYLNVRDFGAVGDGVTDDTEAIQAAIDAAHDDTGTHFGAIVYFPPGDDSYMFTNLTLWAFTKIEGSQMAQCRLQRLAGSTGHAITEKTVADGNTFGARVIWIKELGVDGNNTTGNGIDLGFQNVGINFESWASLENVKVDGFTSGTGIHISANAIKLGWIYANGNQDGIHIEGGYSQFYDIYAEQNTRYQLRASGVGHTFFGIHCEPGSSTDPSILIEGGSQSFYGVSIYFNVNRANCIKIASGTTKTQLHDVYFSAQDGATFTNGIENEFYSAASTGTTPYIQHYEEGDGSVASWYVNMDTGTVLRRLGDNYDTGPLHHKKAIGTTFQTLDTGSKANLRLKDSTAFALGVGGGLLLEGVYNAAGDIVAAGGIKASKANGNDADYSFDLMLGGRTNGSNIAEALRLAWDGTTSVRQGFELANEIAPTQLAANQDDYNPTGLTTAAVMILTSDASRDLTGIVAPARTGKTMWLYNNGAQNIVLKHDATSTAANRLWCRGAADMTLTPKTGVHLYYSATITRWVVMGDTL